MYKSSISDLFRYYGKADFKTFLKCWLIPGYRYTFYLRLFKKYKYLKVFIWFILRRYSFKYGLQIPPHAKIGDGLYIGHFGNVVLNGDVVIGKNCNLSQGVTIGRTNRGRLKGVPKLGDCVWIGANAIIVGGVTVGNNVLIAPGSYVNIDVPDNSLVIGNPCLIKHKMDATEGYINNKI